MQLADEDRSDAVRRDRRLRDRRSGPTRQSGSTGLGSAVQVNSTRHALGIYYSDQPLILFRRAQPLRLGGKPIQIKEHWRFFLVTILLAKIVTGLNQSNK